MSLDLIRELGGQEHWLAVLVTQRPAAGRSAVSVVNAGILEHPTTGEQTVAFVARGRTAKLTHLREDPYATLVFRAGWEWVAVEGPVQIAGPDDELEGLDEEGLRLMLRDIYHAAGGQHDDLDAYDREMAADRRTAVLLTPKRFSTNPPGTEHEKHEDHG